MAPHRFSVRGQIPVGYRVGGTALVASTLLLAAPDDAAARAAVGRGLAFVLKELNDPDMAPSTESRYDVRVWGHACALEFLCNVRAAKAAGKQAAEVESWIPKLIATLVTEEIPGGGWNYANRRQHARSRLHAVRVGLGVLVRALCRTRDTAADPLRRRLR